MARNWFNLNQISALKTKWDRTKIANRHNTRRMLIKSAPFQKLATWLLKPHYIL